MTLFFYFEQIKDTVGRVYVIFFNQQLLQKLQNYSFLDNSRGVNDMVPIFLRRVRSHVPGTRAHL